MLKTLSINGIQPIFSVHNLNWVSNYSIVPPKPSKIPNSKVDYLVDSIDFSKQALKFPNSKVDCLVDSLGFSEQEAFVTSSKVSTTSKSTRNPDSVINFFKINGFSQSQIKHLVSREPRILSCNVDETLKPKIQAFYDLGFSKSDLAHVISLCPTICMRSLNGHIIPTLEILKSVFGNDNELLINGVKQWPWLLGPSAKKKLFDAVSLLQSYGLSDHQIKLFASRKTRYFSLGAKLEAVLIRAENLGIPRESGMFFHGICAICCFTEANLDAKKSIYKSYGFTDEDILTLARRSPYALVLSESKLRSGLDFFMKEVGYLPSQIANISYVLSLSLEKRAIPRYRIWKGLKERSIQIVTYNKLQNINVAFVTCLKITEPQFFERFVQPFKDKCPDLYSDYVKVARPDLF